MVPMAAIFRNDGSHFSRPLFRHRPWTIFRATPTPGEVLVGIRAVRPLRVDHRERARQRRLGLVVVADDQVDAQLAGAIGGGAAADAAVDRDDDPRAGGVQAIDVGRLQAVAVAQALGQEVRDVAAEQLQRAAQDHRRRDPVDVVVAVDGDALLARDRGQQALDRDAEVGQQERIVEMIDRRRQEAGRRLRRVDAALAQQAGDDRRDVERRGQRRDVRVAVARVGAARPGRGIGPDDRLPASRSHRQLSAPSGPASRPRAPPCR